MWEIIHMAAVMSALLWIHMQKGGGLETDTRTTEALGQGPPTPSLRTSTQ